MKALLYEEELQNEILLIYRYALIIPHNGKIIAEGAPNYLKEIMPERGKRLNFESEIKVNITIKLLNKMEFLLIVLRDDDYLKTPFILPEV